MKRGFSERLKLPKDLANKDLLLSVTGNSEVFIENYKGIITYTDKEVLISGKRNQIQLTGKRLAITYYTDDEMRIEGQFENIEYLD